MDDEENFAKIVNRLDYLIDQNISFDRVDQITLYEPKLREPQRTNPWVKPRSRLHESIMQIRQLHEFTDSIVNTGDRAQEEMNLGAGMDDEAAAKKKFLGVKQIDDEDRYDERWDNDAEFVNSIYRTKKNVCAWFVICVQLCERELKSLHFCLLSVERQLIHYFSIFRYYCCILAN